MLWELIVEILWPTWGRRESRLDGVVERKTAGTLAVELYASRALARGLQERGWLDGEVVAAGVLRQGRSPSWPALLLGWALVELVRPRRSKALPREFAIAVTADRVVAFGLNPWREGDGSMDHVVRLNPGELRSWPRGAVRATGLYERGMSKGATLELPTGDRFPVVQHGDSSTEDLIALLAG